MYEYATQTEVANTPSCTIRRPPLAMAQGMTAGEYHGEYRVRTGTRQHAPLPLASLHSCFQTLATHAGIPMISPTLTLTSICICTLWWSCGNKHLISRHPQLPPRKLTQAPPPSYHPHSQSSHLQLPHTPCASNRCMLALLPAACCLLLTACRPVAQPLAAP